MDVCQQCHLETTSDELPQAVRAFGRAVYSFRPGEALSDYLIHFDHAPGTGHDDKFEINSTAYRLRQSQCFQKSGGRLRCTSCHDPHRTPRGDEAIQQFRQSCLKCHQQLSARSHPSPASAACANCHMPKRRTEDVVHVVMTDHRIQRPPPGNKPFGKPKGGSHALSGRGCSLFPDRCERGCLRSLLGCGSGQAAVKLAGTRSFQGGG